MNDGFKSWAQSLETDATSISSLTLGELESGIAQQRNPVAAQSLKTWFETEVLLAYSGRIVEFDLSTSRQWGRLYGTSARDGRRLPVIDSMLAATALVHNLTLVTRNPADFDGLPIQIINPWVD